MYHRPRMLLSVVGGASFFFTYLVLAVGRAPYLRIDRPGAAIVGATLMIAAGVISLDEAYRHIDFRALRAALRHGGGWADLPPSGLRRSAGRDIMQPRG